MRKLLLVLSVIALGFVFEGCGGRRVKFEGSAKTQNVQAEQNLTMTVEWLKNKTNNIDVLTFITNNYDVPVTLSHSDVTLGYEGITVQPSSGEMVTIQPGARVQRLYLFKFGAGKARSGVADLTVKATAPGKTIEPLKVRLTVEAAN